MKNKSIQCVHFFSQHSKILVLVIAAAVFLTGGFFANSARADATPAASLVSTSSINGQMIATSTEPVAVGNSQVAAAVVASQAVASNSNGAYGSIWMWVLIIVAIIIVIIVTRMVKRKKEGLGYPGLRNSDDI